MAFSKKSYSVSLDPETVRLVDEVAADAGLTRSGVINLVLRASLNSGIISSMIKPLASLTRQQVSMGVEVDPDDVLQPEYLDDLGSSSVPGADVSVGVSV